MNSGMSTLVEVITADMSRLTESLLEGHSVRLYSRGGYFTKEQLIPVYFLLIAGCNNDDEYNNFLYNLRNSIKKSGRPFAFIDTPLDEPDSSAMELFSAIDRRGKGTAISGLCGQIAINGDQGRNAIAQKALGDMLTLSSTDVFAVGASLVYKLNMVANAIAVGDSDEIPVIMYYGNPGAADVMFLCYAQRCGFDVICVSPDKQCRIGFEKCPFADKLQKEELPNTRAVMPFPQKAVKVKIATAAYTAERELDTMLYSGDTMFRDRQFSKLDSAVLRTTLDEINILWEQPARYRPGFSVNGDRVVVPTIFAKINGVDDGNIKAYWNMVEEKLTPETVYVIKGPSYRRPDLNVSRIYAPYRNGSKINIEALKRSQLNKYGFLSTDIQDMIFEKMQAVIDDGMLALGSAEETVDYVMYAALNLDRSVLKLFQQFDFTKEIPKFIVVDTIEEPFSKLECTQIILFSYMGFDVLIFSPSGYRDIETWVSENAFETHTFSDFEYNVSAPRFKIPTERKAKKKGLFEKLFRKGR